MSWRMVASERIVPNDVVKFYSIIFVVISVEHRVGYRDGETIVHSIMHSREYGTVQWTIDGGYAIELLLPASHGDCTDDVRSTPNAGKG